MNKSKPFRFIILFDILISQESAVVHVLKIFTIGIDLEGRIMVSREKKELEMNKKTARVWELHKHSNFWAEIRIRGTYKWTWW